MKANINNNQIYSRLPKIWGNIVNFDKADEAVIYAEGFRDVVRPEFDSQTQVLGALFFDEQNDYFTYPIIDLTEEEIRQRQVPSEIRREQGLLMLLTLDKLDTVNSTIEAMPEGEDKQRARFYFDNWSTWERSSVIIASIAPLIFPEDTEKNLDLFFIEASKLR